MLLLLFYALSDAIKQLNAAVQLMEKDKFKMMVNKTTLLPSNLNC